MSSSLRQWVGLATRFLLGVLLSTAHGMIHHVRARAAVWFYYLLVLMRARDADGQSSRFLLEFFTPRLKMTWEARLHALEAHGVRALRRYKLKSRNVSSCIWVGPVMGRDCLCL